MTEDMAKRLLLPNFTTPVPGTLRGVIENDTTPRDKISLNGLGIKKGKSGVASMMLKIVMEVAQYYNVFNYGPPRPQKDLKSQDRKIVAGPGMKPETKFVLPGNIKEKFGKENPPDSLIIDNLETSLYTTAYKPCGNASGDIV